MPPSTTFDNNSKKRAYTANKLAKITGGRSQRVLYRVKSGAMSRLLEMGDASIGETPIVRGDVIVGIFFRGGGRLHALPDYLSDAARGIILVDQCK